MQAHTHARMQACKHAHTAAYGHSCKWAHMQADRHTGMENAGMQAHWQKDTQAANMQAGAGR